MFAQGESVFSAAGGESSSVYRAVNSSIIREFASPCVWFAFRADAVGGALQAVFAALSAHICICGGKRNNTHGIHIRAINQSHSHTAQLQLHQLTIH